MQRSFTFNWIHMWQASCILLGLANMNYFIYFTSWWTQLVTLLSMSSRSFFLPCSCHVDWFTFHIYYRAQNSPSLSTYHYSRRCFISCPNTSNFVKNTPLRVVFSNYFSVFGYSHETLSPVFDQMLHKQLQYPSQSTVNCLDILSNTREKAHERTW